MSLLRLLNDRILIKYWLCCYLKFTPQPSQHLTKSEVFKKQIVWQNMHLQTLICPAPCPPSRRCLPAAARLLPTATPARKKSGWQLHIVGRKLRQKEETLHERLCDIKGQRSSLQDWLGHKECSKRRRATKPPRQRTQEPNRATQPPRQWHQET